jgi:hypothetical protein
VAGLAWLAAAVALGCLLARRFGGLEELPGPRWARALALFGFGAPLGIGLTSCLFWLGRAALPSMPLLPMLLEAALLVWLAWEAYRRWKPAEPQGAGMPAFSWNLALAAALAVAAGISAAAMAGLSEAFPHGNWDAWAIWNVRARFLTAGGELAQRAWSDAITHPNYPQLLPGFVARCWAYGGTISVSAPIATGFLFWAALLSLVTGGVALLRGPSLGLLSGLVLVGAPFFLREAPSQYADVPLACFMAGALLLLLLARPALAGAFAGLAAWTKDEGLLFLAVFIVAAALFRRGWLRAAAGAIPAAALVLVFKLAIASGSRFHARPQPAFADAAPHRPGPLRSRIVGPRLHVPGRALRLAPPGDGVAGAGGPAPLRLQGKEARHAGRRRGHRRDAGRIFLRVRDLAV